MSLSRHELEELADDTYRDRRIKGSTFCGRCGYNLRTLPYVYRCPECGNAYNARPLKMKGIFFPQAVYPPVKEMVATAFFSVIGVLLLISAIKPLDQGRLIFGVIFIAITGVFAGQVVHKFQHFFTFWSLAKRIAEEEED
ncbi:MAG: hypothetical protein ACYTFA_10505 [Planctomycetota bacterium]|jgi:hypothetical protein